jgi:glycosyltransferase involved in cell wall biosynthesis
MKLLYVTDRLSHHGGAPRHLLDIIHAMAPRHTVTVAASAKDAEVILPQSVHFVRVPGLRSAGSETGKINKLLPLIDDADLVHTQNVMNPTTLMETNKHRSIVTVQDHRVFCPGPGKTLPSGEACTEEMNASRCSECLPDAAYRNRMLQLTQQRLEALRSADLVITLSAYMANELEKLNVSNVHVLPPPIETDEEPVMAGHGFLIAGRLVQHKGTTLAHQAWRASGTNHPLRVAGLGREAEHLEGSEPLGWLDRTSLRHALRQSRALLFPTRWQEPFGIIGVEALSAGTPVIAMLCGGMNDWAQEGVIGIQPGDVQAMSDAICLLASEPNTAVKLGMEGKRYVHKAFEPNALMSKLERLYKSTC